MSDARPKRKLMVVGAGVCQVPIIRKARARGYAVLAVSAPGDYPGLRLADRAFEIDVRETEAIGAVARAEGIRGILTDQTDLPVPTVARVAERLGLPGIDPDCAVRFTHKAAMREACEAIGVPVPRHGTAATLAEAGQAGEAIGYPLVVKPVDSQGSRGVRRIRDPAGLAAGFHEALAHSAAGAVILEELVPGREIVVEGFFSGGVFANLAVGDRVYFKLPDVFIPKATLFPARLPPALEEKVRRLNRRLVTALAPRFAITHSEFLVDERTGDVRLVETAARGGGVFISSDLIPLASGFDANEALIELACGERDALAVDEARLSGKAAGYLCFTVPAGIVEEVRGADELRSLPGVHAAHLDGLEPGTPTTPMRDKTMRRGPILLRGDTREELDRTMEQVRETLRVRVKTSRGTEGIRW